MNAITKAELLANQRSRYQHPDEQPDAELEVWQRIEAQDLTDTKFSARLIEELALMLENDGTAPLVNWLLTTARQTAKNERLGYRDYTGPGIASVEFLDVLRGRIAERDAGVR